jgi:hypothetical protein
VSSQDNRSRVWSAAEINEQLDQVAEVLLAAPAEIMKGFLFGAPRPKPERHGSRRHRQETARG